MSTHTPSLRDIDWNALEAAEGEAHRAAMRDQAVALEGYTRDRRDHRGCVGACGSWSGPAPLGGKRAHCRKVGEMREARA